MDKITDACKAGAEKVKEAVSGSSKEANKEVAKDSSQSAGTRVGAAIDAAGQLFFLAKNTQLTFSLLSFILGDKIDESKHAANKEVHKQKATH